MTFKTVIATGADILLLPLTVLSSAWLWAIRRVGVRRMRISRAIFDWIGVFPIRDHYYEPLWNPGSLRMSLRDDRHLPGLDLNVSGQMALLDQFTFSEELKLFPLERPGNKMEYYYHNGAYESGDAEYLYSVIRLFKPLRLLEVGSGFSTLIAREAIRANHRDDPGYQCQHVCIEPYEQLWLEDLGVTVIRDVVERVDPHVFTQLGVGDMLFVDSSHIIRPQGDVLWIYQNMLPALQAGVLVHVHDVFTPKDYPDRYVLQDRLLWNEQYLLEAFLAFNRRFEVIGALNYLAHNFRTLLAEKCPVYALEAAEREPGAFWLRSL